MLTQEGDVLQGMYPALVMILVHMRSSTEAPKTPSANGEDRFKPVDADVVLTPIRFGGYQADNSQESFSRFRYSRNITLPDEQRRGETSITERGSASTIGRTASNDSDSSYDGYAL